MQPKSLHNVASFFQGLTWSQPMTEQEASFCRQRLERRDRSLADACMTMACFYHSASLYADRFIVAPADQPIMARMHVSLLLCYFVWYAVLRHTKLKKAVFIWPLQVTFVATMALVVHGCVERGALQDIVMASCGLLAVSTLMILMCPFHGPMILVSAVIYTTLAAVGLEDSGFAWRWILVSLLITTATTVFQYLQVARTLKLAALEFRTLSQAAPAQIVRRAVDLDASIEEDFKPEMRLCACISTDWRNFQSFSRGATPKDLAANLNDYYDLTEELLRVAIPHGNCYSDWIADELFVVIFANEGQTAHELAEQALAFAYALIQAKPEFLKTHAMPLAIDLGISIGEALVGMMGPSSHRKATALGESPGRARRYQSTGKLIRHLLGHEDRIIFGAEVIAANLTAAHEVKTLPISKERKLRDLDTQVLHYIEPNKPALLNDQEPPPPPPNAKSVAAA